MDDFKSSYIGIIVLGVISSLIATVAWEHRKDLFDSGKAAASEVQPTHVATGAIPTSIPSSSTGAPNAKEAGGGPAPHAGPPTDNPSNENPPDSRDKSPSDLDDAKVQNAVQDWSQALLSNDPSRIAVCYADQVDRFFRKTDTTKDQVLSYYETARSAGKVFESVSISKIYVDHQLDPKIRAQFEQHFTYGGKTANVRTVLHFIRTEDGLKIDFERQFSSSALRPDASHDASP